jgi:hypothetical protein
MENREMNRQEVVRELVLRLQSLSREHLASVLVQYALELTILARAYHLEERVDLAKDCNEVLHRLLGFLGKQLRGAGDEERDSMIHTLVESASKKGRLEILKGSVRQATGQ